MKEFFYINPYLITTGGAEPGVPDDTVASISHALQLGSEAIRSNVSLTRDGKLVIFSDSVLENPSLMKNDMSAFEHARLRELHVNFLRGSGGTAESSREIMDLFPLMEHVLESFPSSRFNFNLQGRKTALADSFRRVVERTGSSGRVLVSSISGETIGKVRALMPGVATSFSFIGLAGFYALFRSGLLYFRKKFRADALIMPEAMGVSFFASPALVHEARERGLRVYVLGVNDGEMARRLRHAGVDGIITNNITAVKDISI